MLGYAKGIVVVLVELGRHSTDAAPTNSWNASIIWHACQMIDAFHEFVGDAHHRQGRRSQRCDGPAQPANRQSKISL